MGDSVDVSDSRLQIEGLQEKRPIIIVDKESEDPWIYKSIGEAIIAAKDNNIIHIASGIYCESIVIRTPGLLLEPLEEEGKVVIVSTQKPCLRIELDRDCKVELK